MTRKFNPSGEPHSCKWCGVKLKPRFEVRSEIYIDPDRQAESQAVIRQTSAEHRRLWDAGGVFRASISWQYKSREDIDDLERRSLDVAGTSTREIRTDNVIGYGYDDGDQFCTLRCGFAFGSAFASAGHALRKSKPGEWVDDDDSDDDDDTTYNEG